MKILFISKHKWPEIGGVERHIKGIIDRLEAKGNNVTVISAKDVKYPKIKFIGLLYIWFWFFKKINIFVKSDIIHVHDVFIWVLPIRLFLFWKKFYITFHGWEGVYPIPVWNILNKKLAFYLCSGSIVVGNYINKYYGIKSNFVIHGAVDKINNTKFKKDINSIVWLGRQDEDTGIKEFKKWLMKNPKFEVTYVTNVKTPEKYLKTAEYCVPSGYLSYLESLKLGCKIITFANNPLKVDYWKEIKSLKYVPTWDEIAKVYIKLWRY